MTKLSIMGQYLYIRMKPTFPGAKSGVLCAMPRTALNPTVPQIKARLWLAEKAVSLTNTFGSVSDAGKGKGGPRIALEIFKAGPGVGTHGGKSMREYVVARRKGQAGIETIRKQLSARSAMGVLT